MKKRQDMPAIDASIPPAGMQRTELQARQIDLEIQNEELLQARDLLEESRDRYIDFYDFSPVGYLTLSHKALITEINLTGAAMLGDERSNLRRRRFAEFLALEDNDFWNRHFMAARQHEGKLTCELCILRADGYRMDVQIDSLRLARDSLEPVVRLALTDITERKRAEAALRASEAQRRLLEQQKIIQTSLDGFWVTRVKDARILEANEAFCNMVGYSRAELLIMCISELEADESPDEIAAHIKKVMAIGYDRFETRHRHKQGHLIDLEVSVSYSESDGGVNFVFVRDITERKRMEKSLVSRERELRALAESSPGMMGSFYLRPDGSMCMPYVTSKIWAHFGLTPQDVAVDATPLLARTHPDDAQMVQDSIAESARSLTTWHEEYRILHPAKGERWMESNTNPEPHPDGGVMWYGNVHDITERKVAEGALRASEQQFRTLAENFPDILIRYDREGRRTYVNPAMERMFSVTEKQTIGLSPQEANPVELPEIYLQALKHTLATGERSEFEMELPLPSGEVRTGFIYIVAERAVDGRISGAITIGRDITRLKQTERQLRELAAHLQSAREEEKAHLARELHDDLGQILFLLKLKVSGYVHDCVANSGGVCGQLQEAQMLTDRAIGTARNIVSALRPPALDYGIAAALKWLVENFVSNMSIQCELQIADEEIRLDESKSLALFRIVQEALNNIAKHAQADKVGIALSKDATGYVLSVRDNGTGFDTSKKKKGSFGLVGMRERALMHGGTVFIESRAGTGTEIVVRIAAD
ncbi:MAG: PAS domain S-box protein [Gallionella sp.]|jgi:PAS domain S-box-containing protein|nr:PAS domain S-box protein [Gallionella sp.]MCK9354231.1 PAS domain S-box protein [Gallionella sp.]